LKNVLMEKNYVEIIYFVDENESFILIKNILLSKNIII
jgi:hypothetical protein